MIQISTKGYILIGNNHYSCWVIKNYKNGDLRVGLIYQGIDGKKTFRVPKASFSISRKNYTLVNKTKHQTA